MDDNSGSDGRADDMGAEGFDVEVKRLMKERGISYDAAATDIFWREKLRKGLL
jgi:hypothetical protein